MLPFDKLLMVMVSSMGKGISRVMVLKVFSFIPALRSLTLALAVAASMSIFPGLIGQAGAASCSYGETAYGQGAYSTCAMAAPVIQLGPISLPDTGATWLGLIGAACFAIGVGLFVWARQRRRHRLQTT